MQAKPRLLDTLEQTLKTRTSSAVGDEFTLRGIWKIEMAFSPTAFDPPFRDTIVLAQTSGSGFCTCYNENPDIPVDWIGRDVRELSSSSPSLKIAILDAAYSCLVKPPTFSVTLQGASSKKALSRASLIVHEIVRVANNKAASNLRVLIVGAVGSIISELVRIGAKVYATDLDNKVIGRNLEGVTIENGNSKTIPLVEFADVALITGMTISTNTFDEILAVCAHNNTRVVMFAQTGANFASEYLKYGVNTVIAESFPNYIFPGDTLVRVFRDANNRA